MREILKQKTARRVHWAGFGFCCLLCVVALICATAPPVRVDSLVYHLALPKLYLAAGGWFETPWNIYSYFPNLVGMGYYGLMALGVKSPQVLHALIGMAVLGQTWVLSKRVGLSSPARWIAVFGVLLTPEFFKEMTWAYVDLASVVFWQWGFLLFLKWRENPSSGPLIWMGAAAAGAVSVKYPGLLLPLVLVLLVLLEMNRSGRAVDFRFMRGAVAAVAVLLTLTSWWWIRNALTTGNPLFPFFNGVFGSNHAIWTDEQIRQFMQFVNQFGGAGTGGILQRISGAPLLFLTWFPALGAKFDGTFNFWFLAAFGSVFWIKKNPVLKAVWIVIFVKGVFWIFSTQQVRFILDLAPFFAIAAAWVVEKVANRAARQNSGRLLPGGLIAVFCVIGLGNLWNIGGYLIRSQYGLGIQPSKQESYLEARLPYYRVYQHINRHTPPDAVIGMVLTGAQTYYLDRPFKTDTVFEERRFKEMLLSSDSAEEVFDKMRADGWDYMLTCTTGYQPLDWLEKQYHPLMQAVFQGMTLECRDKGYLLFKVPAKN